MQNKRNKVLKACVAGILGCGILASSAFGAEKDGAYMGVELGANRVKFKQTLDYAMLAGNTLASGDIKADNLMPSVAIKGGYKMFFGEERRFGFRAYGAVGVGYGRLINVKYSDSIAQNTMLSQAMPNLTNSVFSGTGKTYYTTFIDYYVGADLLYNFAPKNDVIWGVFAGVGVGGVTWAANGKEYEVSNGDRSYFNFAATANLGLRATIKDKHGIELGARVYFPKSEIFDASNGTSPLVPEPARQGVSIDTTTTHYRPFSVVLSYIYNF